MSQAVSGSVSFHDIDWDAPFDLKEYSDVVSSSATIKGVFFTDLAKQVQKVGGTLKLDVDYSAFKDYPLRDYMKVCLDAAKLVYPTTSTRRALGKMGRSVFPTFVSTLSGKVLMGVMGTDVVSIMKVMNKAASMTMNCGQVTTVEAGPGRAILRLKDVYFTDTYQVGVLEGVLQATQKRGAKVMIDSTKLNDAHMQLTWQD
jgi:uncharacterized protein (TIGR02265 family)